MFDAILVGEQQAISLSDVGSVRVCVEPKVPYAGLEINPDGGVYRRVQCTGPGGGPLVRTLSYNWQSPVGFEPVANFDVLATVVSGGPLDDGPIGVWTNLAGTVIWDDSTTSNNYDETVLLVKIARVSDHANILAQAYFTIAVEQEQGG